MEYRGNYKMVRVRDFSEMIEPILEILYHAKMPMHINDINSNVIEMLNISKQERSVIHGDSKQTELEYRLGWARTYLKKYGLINNPERALWVINENYKGEKITMEQVIYSVKKNILYEHIVEESKPFNIKQSNEDNILEVSKKYFDNKVSLFLGAGVSIAANLPSWDDLIAELLIKKFENETTYQNHDGELGSILCLEKANREHSMISQTRFIKQNLEPKKYVELLQEALYKNTSKINLANPLFDILIKMIRNKNDIKIKNIVTFNFDDLLELKLKEVGIAYYQYTDLSNKHDNSEVSISHVYGFLPLSGTPDEIDIDEIIFSEEQYHKMYCDPFHWSNMKQLVCLRENTCFFIGCSLTDPNMRRILDIAKSKTNRKHYAILKIDEIKKPKDVFISDDLLEKYKNFHVQSKTDYFESLGVNVIWVESFTQVPEVIQEIIKRD